jgi:RNA polymerase sigma factor (sigma-70 family)
MATMTNHLRRAVLGHHGAGLTDAPLLGRFVENRDGDAVAALVRRHGPMVWGVCRRLLASHHDAEDAFQATFLVLVRKAASIVPREMVGNWLYGVARKTALKAQQTAVRRRRRETAVADMPEPTARQERDDGLRLLLDDELSHLPDKYRVAVVLCDLEGRTRQEAARQLGVPLGTLSARLARARAMLAKRLAVSGGSVPALLMPEAASAWANKAVTLVAAGQAVASAEVAALAEGVVKTMLLSKLKAAVAVLLAVAVLCVGGAALVWQARGAEQGRPQSANARRDDLKETILDLDERWWKADVAALRSLAADDLITVSGVGRYDKASLLAASSNRHAADWAKRDVEVSLVSKEVAIITYVYDCKVLLADGTLFQECKDRRLSMTWAKRQGGWVVVFSHETVLPGGQ